MRGTAKFIRRFQAPFIILLFCSLSPAYAADPYNYPVKSLYAQPDGRSKIVFQIPIDVRMLDMSEDANWYKVAIKFSLGPVEFKYTGWAYVPVGNILIKRAEEASGEATSSE